MKVCCVRGGCVGFRWGRDAGGRRDSLKSVRRERENLLGWSTSRSRAPPAGSCTAGPSAGSGRKPAGSGTPGLLAAFPACPAAFPVAFLPVACPCLAAFPVAFLPVACLCLAAFPVACLPAACLPVAFLPVACLGPPVVGPRRIAG